MPLSVGDKLGHYEILAPIGAGGMGEVYRAKDTKLRRDVALKVLPDAFAGDPERMARFQRAAEVLASLNHPNIAQIYSVEERALAMELVAGEAPKGPMPFDEAWKIVSQIAAALEYAHDKGIIHRDLKPANIKVTPDGTVKLLDFGLAKAFSNQKEPSASPENSPTLTIGATEVGVVLGTAAYMPPEQAKGKSVDKRADIWAFGVVFYELLTGTRPFKGEDVSETLVAVIRDEPDLSKAPPTARRLLERCLEKDPKQRLRDIGEARHMIEEPSAIAVSASTWGTLRYRLGWIISGVLAVAAAGFAALWLRPAPLPQVMRFEIHAPPGGTLPLGTPAVSPDGRTLAFTVNDPAGISRIHLRGIDRVETRVLPGTEGAVHPFWSPDGRSLAFAASGDGSSPSHLKRIDVEGGAVLDLIRTGGPWHGAWNQYGEILFPDAGIMRISAQGGPATRVLTPDGTQGSPSPLGHPFFLQDGKRFLVLVSGGGKSSIQLTMLGSTNRTMVLDDVESGPILAPTPEGKTYLLYLRESDLYGQAFDERSGTLRGNPVLVVSNVGRVANPAVRATVGASPAGILAYQTGGAFDRGQLTWFDRTGKRHEALPEEASGRSPEISPGGSLLAVRRTNASGSQNIWITDLARNSPSRLTFGTGRDTSAVWSPDEKRLAYLSLAAKDGGVYILDMQDPSKRQLIQRGVAPTSWSLDGKYLLLASPLGSMTLLPFIGDQKPIPVGSRNGRSSQGRISPDGKFIAFTSDESGQPEVEVQPMPPGAGQTKVSIGGGRYPRWRRDGKELFFVSADLWIMAVAIKPGPPFSAGVPHRLFQMNGGADPSSYDVRGDGQMFLIYVPQGEARDATITVVVNWWAELPRER